jgi:phosphatidylserine/phosphatidylglycerophosphate/cardiolipin synthase-like enzyme
MSLLLLLLLALSPVEVIESGPEGTELDRAGVRNALDAFPDYFSRAESTIDIAEMYMLYYPPESKGRAVYRLYDALIAAAQRGVRVRILLDSTTLEANRGETYQRMQRKLDEVPGIEVQACDLRPHSAYDGCMMHAKYFVVDQRLAVVGSHNWSYAGFADNVELSLAVEDTALARELADVFESDWQGERLQRQTKSEARSESAEGRARLVVTSPEQMRDSADLGTAEALTETFGGAESTLDIIVNSISTRVDFGPAERYCLVDSLIRDADGRGVRVRLLVDYWAREHDSTLLWSLDSLAHVEVRVADIRTAGPNPRTGSVHAKVVIADRATVLLGSATFSQRQIEECRNVGVLLADSATAATLTDLFERCWFSVWCGRP